MGSSHTLDQLDICFDTHAVANAGLLLPATLRRRRLVAPARPRYPLVSS